MLISQEIRLEASEQDAELRYVYGKCLAEVYFRQDGSTEAFFRRVEKGGDKKVTLACRKR